MPCPAQSFPAFLNSTVSDALESALYYAVSINVTSSLNTSINALEALYCASDSATTCYGICPNADLAGVGVRAAFYLSSLLQALLVFISPEDSSAGVWSAALLTASVTIPALMQKRSGALSAYHATLVLNFATFASIVSLAVAERASVWRMHEEELDHEGEGDDVIDRGSTSRRAKGVTKKEHEVLRKEHSGEVVASSNTEATLLGQGTLLPVGELNIELPLDPANEQPQPNSAPRKAPLDSMSNLPRQKVHRQRIILALALLMQVVLQLSFIITLFTSPEFAQRACSPFTLLVLFGVPISVKRLNRDRYWVWLVWLAACALATMISVCAMVYGVGQSNPDSGGASPDDKCTRSTTELQHNFPVSGYAISHSQPSKTTRLRVSPRMVLALCLALLLLISCEMQVAKNCVLGGENTSWSFGQVAALFVAITPAWSIVTAIARKQQSYRVRLGEHNLDGQRNHQNHRFTSSPKLRSHPEVLASFPRSDPRSSTTQVRGDGHLMARHYNGEIRARGRESMHG